MHPPSDEPAGDLPTGPDPPREGTPLIVARRRLAAIRELLDPPFAAVGLHPEAEAATYVGTFDGRAVRVACSVRTRVRYATSAVSYRQFAGLTLRITVPSPLRTRLAVSPPLRIALAGADNVVVRAVILAAERFGNRRDRLVALPGNQPEAPVRTRAADPRWAGELLGPEVRRTLHDLLPARDLGTLNPVGRWHLGIVPGSLHLDLTPEAATITAPNLARWVRAAVLLAREAEGRPPADLPEPAVPASSDPGSSPSPAERSKADLLPGLLVLFGCLAAVPLALLLALGAGWALLGEKVMLFPIAFASVLMPYAMYLVARNFVRSASHRHRRRQEPHWSERTEPDSAGNHARPTPPGAASRPPGPL